MTTEKCMYWAMLWVKFQWIFGLVIIEKSKLPWLLYEISDESKVRIKYRVQIRLDTASGVKTLGARLVLAAGLILSKDWFEVGTYKTLVQSLTKQKLVFKTSFMVLTQ